MSQEDTINLHITTLKNEDWLGFVSIHALQNQKCMCVPKQRGVYLVLYCEQNEPRFLVKGTGGFYRGDPNIPIPVLEEAWVKDSIIVYIGKAGSKANQRTLKDRLNEYMKFGLGKKVGHWGGRMIWQLENAGDLILCWKILPDSEPRDVEKQLIKQHIKDFGQRPFANRQD